MYKCKYFEIHELVPPHVYAQRAERSWELLDENLLITLDKLRERYGAMTVNNYHWGGEREWSGLRTPGSPFYSQYSQHSFGRAADCLFKTISAEEVRQDIIENTSAEAFGLISGIEMSVSWLHVDVRNCQRIRYFNP